MLLGRLFQEHSPFIIGSVEITTLFDNQVPSVTIEENLASIPEGTQVYEGLIKVGWSLIRPSEISMISFVMETDDEDAYVHIQFKCGKLWKFCSADAESLAKIFADQFKFNTEYNISNIRTFPKDV